MIYFPPSTAEMVQPIDTGYGRSMKAAIGRESDLWLMNGENILKWEDKMTKMGRRILVIHVVAQDQEYILHKDRDRQRISCFERPGCPITTEVCVNDILIKPQEVTVPFIVLVIPQLKMQLKTMEMKKMNLKKNVIEQMSLQE